MRYALLVLMIGGVSVLRPQAQEPQPPPADLVVKIAAERFSFTPSQVKSQVGKVIEFNMSAATSFVQPQLSASLARASLVL